MTTAAADLLEPDAAGMSVEKAAALGDGLDVLLCNAGHRIRRGPGRDDAAHWEQTLAVNARAPFLLCRAPIPGTVARGHGVIVNVASAVALAAVARSAAYGASKSAVIG